MQSDQCNRCINANSDNTCSAFPNGIPEEVLLGEFDHRKPYPNKLNPQDQGIRFVGITKDSESLVFDE